MNKAKFAGLFFTTLLLIFAFAACGKKEVNRGGEDTNFPYSWEDKNKGQVLVKLDGNYGDQEYSWNYSCDTEEVITITPSGKEKKGITSFILKPLAEGEAVITFTREKEVEDAPLEADVKIDDFVAEKPEDTEAPEEPEMAQEPESSYDPFAQLYTVKDKVSEIQFRVIVTKNEKGDELETEVLPVKEAEMAGVLEGDSDVAYKLWEDDTEGAVLRLPYSEDLWTFEVSSEYEPVKDSNPDDGMEAEEPETGEDGKVKVVEVSFNGFYGSESCFLISGKAKGTATVTFVSPDGSEKIVIDVAVDENRKLSIVSHKSES